MAFYVDKDLGQGTVTSKDYDLYCHYGECTAVTQLDSHIATYITAFNQDMCCAVLCCPSACESSCCCLSMHVSGLSCLVISHSCMSYLRGSGWSGWRGSEQTVRMHWLRETTGGRCLQDPSQHHGAFAAENQHHPRLLGRLCRRQGILAARGTYVMGLLGSSIVVYVFYSILFTVYCLSEREKEIWI
jgi:hypothetical protein